jgi:small subunit ribosomal protein S1
VEDLTEYVGSLLKVKVIDFNREDKRVILSRKEVEAQEQAAKKSMLMDTVKKGDRYQGTVVNIKDFGAFVDIGGVQGLIHKQDLSWEKVKHPSDILQIGDQVDVYVIDIDHKNEKISFGLKDIKEDPWANAINDYQVGQILSGEVVRIASYGAFVSLGNGIEGLVHISEMSEKRIARPQEVTAVGDKVKVKIINIDKEAKRIQLSMKSVEEDIDQEQLKDFQSTEEATTSLEDVFKVFLKDINN